MIRVVIADDHTIVRHGLKQIVDSAPEMEVVAEAKDGNEVLRIARDTPIDVVVLDISMPGKNGLETLKDLKREFPEISVIVLSMYPSDQYAIRVLRAGASGYITKESAPEELVIAIRKAQTGSRYINSEVAELLADNIEHGTSEIPHLKLSDREYEVFCGIGAGKNITQISQELSLSVKTVSTYRTRILEKTKLGSNAEIIRYCIKQNLA